MKIKYKFEEINTASDTIKVSCGTEDIITLKKSDFDNSWGNALNKDYYITDFQCNDLANLTVTGIEDHGVSYDENLNIQWKEFTQNKVGSKHINDTLVTSTLDIEKPIIAYNQDAFTTTSDVANLIHKYFKQFSGSYKLDFSKLDISSFTSSTSSLGHVVPIYSNGLYYIQPSGNGYSTSEMSNADYTAIVSWFDLPEGLTNMDYAFYKTGISKLPKIPSTVTHMDYTFEYSSITKVDDLDLPNVTSGNQLFSYCTSLEEIGNINIPKGSFIIAGCTNLKKVGNITASQIQINNDSNTTSLIEEIGDLTCTGSSSILITNTGITNKQLLKLGNILSGSGALRVYNVTSDTCIGNVTDCYPIELPCTIAKMGIINLTALTVSNSYLFSKYLPRECIAVPSLLYKCKGNGLANTIANIPSSTGTDLWFDYNIYTDNEFIHNITNPIYTVSGSKETTNTSETVYIKGLYVLEKNAAYNHTFELIDCSLNTSTSTAFTSTTGTNITASGVKFTLNEDGTADIEIPCINIKDDVVSSGTITRTIFYTAKIDGNEFHGATKVSVNFSYTWSYNESVLVDATIVNDDESTIESTSNESSESAEETVETTEDTEDNASTEDN